MTPITRLQRLPKLHNQLKGMGVTQTKGDVIIIEVDDVIEYEDAFIDYWHEEGKYYLYYGLKLFFSSKYKNIIEKDVKEQPSGASD